MINFTTGIQIFKGQKITKFTFGINWELWTFWKNAAFQDGLTERMSLQAGRTDLVAELALLCTQHQKMVHKLWKSSCPRGSLANYPGRPRTQSVCVRKHFGTTDFTAQGEPKQAVKNLAEKLAESHKGQIQNLPDRDDFTAKAEELTHFLSCFTLNGDKFPQKTPARFCYWKVLDPDPAKALTHK